MLISHNPSANRHSPIANLKLPSNENPIMPNDGQPRRNGVRATERAYTGLRQTVALDAAPEVRSEGVVEALRRAIERSGPNSTPSTYLHLLDKGSSRAALRVRAGAGGFGIYSREGELLVGPDDLIAVADADAVASPEEAAVAAVGALEAIVRYNTVAGLEVLAPMSPLTGKVSLSLRRYVTESGEVRLEECAHEASGPDSNITVYFDPSAEERNRYVVDLINSSGIPIYPNVFALSPDYSIRRLYPNNSQTAPVQPNDETSPFTVGLDYRNERLRLWLPPGWDASRDCLLAIVSTAPCDLAFLEQRGISFPLPTRASTHATRPPRAALERLLDALVFGSGKRVVVDETAWEREPWSVVISRINTVRAYQPLALAPLAGVIPLGDGLSLEKPEGFAGTVTTGTLGQLTGGADGDPDLKPPPGLEAFPGLFQPLVRARTRGGGSRVLALAFHVDEDSRRTLSPSNPLRISVPSLPDGATTTLAVAWDGRDYALVGQASDNPDVVEIPALPPRIAQPSAERPNGKYDIRTGVCLFLYRQLGEPSGPAVEAFDSLKKPAG
jgi:hypothetical protein